MVLGLALDLGQLLHDSRFDNIDLMLTYGGPLISIPNTFLFFIKSGEALEQSFAFVWNRRDGVLERHEGESTRSILVPAEGNFLVVFKPAPWIQDKRISRHGPLNQVLEKSFVTLTEGPFFLYKVNQLKKRDPEPIVGELHDDPRVHFQMAFLLFSFLVRTLSDQCTFAVQMKNGNYKIEAEADLSAMKAWLSLHSWETVSDLFPEE